VVLKTRARIADGLQRHRGSRPQNYNNRGRAGMMAQSGLRLWQTLAVGLAATGVAVVLLSVYAASRVTVPGAQGFLGYEATPARFDGFAAHRLTRFAPESPLPGVGIEAGDLIVDPPRGSLLAGQVVPLRVARDDVVHEVSVTARHIERLATPLQNGLDMALEALALALGLIIALRRPRDRGALVLACAFLLGVGGLYTDAFPSGRIAGVLWLWTNTCGVLAVPLLAYFSLVFEGGYVGTARRSLEWAVRLLGLAGLVWAVLAGPYFLGRAWVDPQLWLTVLRPGLQAAGVLVCVVAFTDTWRHARAQHRARLRWLFLTFALVLLNFLLLSGFYFGALGFGPAAAAAVSIGGDACVATAMLLVTYAILRHRVIDVGFVINRALVYAAFTGALLVCFGLVEWFVEHFVRFERRERSALLDAVIAVTLYLAFHRARHGIERVIERTFFRAWHEREAQLRHFTEQAPHFSEAASLIAAFLAAVDAYTGSRGSGLYLRDEAGRFHLQGATLADLPRELGADAPVAIELKTVRAPVPLGTPLALGAAVLAMPMLRRADLEAFLVIGDKPTHESYRPDQIDNLAGATRQVGFDLYALRFEQLKEQKHALEQQNEGLRQTLRALPRAPQRSHQP